MDSTPEKNLARGSGAASESAIWLWKLSLYAEQTSTVTAELEDSFVVYCTVLDTETIVYRGPVSARPLHARASW